MAVLKLTSLGNSTGLVIPKEMLERLRAGEGDELFALETPNGYFLTSHDPDLEEELRLGREFMRKYDETFRSLAK
ncbi:MAG TPA: AbrB/MazE/SpoVT family DNA-binding domain-containing protein [Candidatus Angelobacter sp.]|jgi:putative addiction module antidote